MKKLTKFAELGRLCGPSWARMRPPDYEFQIGISTGLHRFVEILAPKLAPIYKSKTKPDIQYEMLPRFSNELMFVDATEPYL